MMIELKGRGFALLATVLSFIADNRDTQESIRCDWVRLQIQIEFSRRGDNPSLVGFRHSSLNSAETDPVSGLSRDEMLV
jgi:hypothetical protein